MLNGRPPKGKLIAAIETANISAGGIILPPEIFKNNIGVILQSGIKDAPPGKKIAVVEENIKEIEIDGEIFASLEESDILMITK